MGEELLTSKIAASDAELVRLALAGSSYCFEELVWRYQVPLIRFLLSRSISRHDAEDLMQDTFLRAYQSLGKYNDAWPFKTWIFTMAYRLAVSQHRARPAAAAHRSAECVADSRSEPLGTLQQKESQQHLWDLAQSILSEPQFTAVWLYYVESLTTLEIARVMNRSWVSVKTSLHRARQKLHMHLKNEDELAATVTGEGV